MNLRALLILTLAMPVAATIAQAQDAQDVIEVTSDANEGRTFHFAVQTDSQGDMTELVYYEAGHDPTHIPMEKLRRGYVLMHNEEHDLDVITVAVEDGFDSQNGGQIRLKYAYNGLTRSFRNYTLALSRDGERWNTYTAREHKWFSHMHFASRKIFGHTAGVAYIGTW
jgi:hypothetical protein